jgi:hypothetical protein
VVVSIVREMDGALIHFLAIEMLFFEVQVFLQVVDLVEGHFEFFL